MKNTIDVGDTVMHRGWFGKGEPAPAKVVAMELCKAPRMKDGIPVKSVSLLDKARLVLTLDTGEAYKTWAYGFQVEPMPAP